MYRFLSFYLELVEVLNNMLIKSQAEIKQIDNVSITENSENGTVNGALWNAHRGSMQDWNYEFAHCMEVTVYTGCCHSPSEETLIQLWKAHYPALVALIQQVTSIIPNNRRESWSSLTLN